MSGLLESEYFAKVLAELAEADEVIGGEPPVRSSGDAGARIMLVKGEPGPSDLEAGEVLAGADGEAARSALTALGLEALGYFATCSRQRGQDPAALTTRLRLQLEAVDPSLVVALDRVAAEDIASAAGMDAPPSGVLSRHLGRQYLVLDGLEDSLGDEARKRRIWGQMQSLRGA